MNRGFNGKDPEKGGRNQRGGRPEPPRTELSEEGIGDMTEESLTGEISEEITADIRRRPLRLQDSLKVLFPSL